jgi:ATP-binding cassette subfamily B protein
MRKEITTRDVFKYIVKVIKPFPAAISVMFLVSFVWAIDLSVRPYLIKIMLDRINDTPQNEIFAALMVPAIIYVCASFFVSSLFRLYGYFVEIKMIPCLRERIANDALGRLVDQSHTYYQNTFSGALANRVNDLTNSIPDIVQVVIDRFFSHALAISIAIYTLWIVNINFALAMMGWTVVFLSVSLYFSKRLANLADAWSETGSTITGKVVDALSNILSVRLFSRKAAEKQDLAKTFDRAVKAEQNLQWTYFWVWVHYGYSFAFVQGLNLYFLLEGIEDGSLTIGDFALVLSINIAIVDFLWQLTKEFSDFSKLLGRTSQALKTILEVPEIQDKPGATTLAVTKGEIAFDKVKFHYKSAEALFHNKSITIKPGQKVGLVGYSGSGKTTFVNLILRIYEVTEGKILIDKQDISKVTQDSLRVMIGMIPQDPSLFNRSLMENIRYGRVEATDAEVIEAAKRAHAHEFISKLPEGYNTLVGERGVKVSGGQRQRIAIARAILKNAPILILDEATSQLDSVTESEIQDSLWELMQDKTTLIIAHRLSTLLHMDRILVFNQGKIVEDGTHEELLEKGGMYKTLWNAQIGGFLPDKG